MSKKVQQGPTHTLFIDDLNISGFLDLVHKCSIESNIHIEQNIYFVDTD